MFSKLMIIGLGGFLGALMRYETNMLILPIAKNTQFPIATVTINIIGCFVIGALSQLVESQGILSGQSGEFVFIGLLGAFTTFSTFSNETFELARSGNFLYAFFNMSIHLLLGLFAIWAGHALVSRFI